MAQTGLTLATGSAGTPDTGGNVYRGQQLQTGSQDPFATAQRTPDAKQITDCAHRYKIDEHTLIGIYQVGPPGGSPHSFAFPRQYGSAGSLGQAACGTARYLVALGAHANLTTAVERYGGNSGAYATKVKHAANRDKGTPALLDQIKVPNPIADVASAIAAAFGWLGIAENWVRIAEGVVGAVIVYLGLHALTGAGPTPATLARKVR